MVMDQYSLYVMEEYLFSLVCPAVLFKEYMVASDWSSHQLFFYLLQTVQSDCRVQTQDTVLHRKGVHKCENDNNCTTYRTVNLLPSDPEVNVCAIACGKLKSCICLNITARFQYLFFSFSFLKYWICSCLSHDQYKKLLSSIFSVVLVVCRVDLHAWHVVLY